MKKIVTTEMMAEAILKELKENGKVPDILDYASVNRYDVCDICDIEFDIKTDLRYGGNEGIYLLVSLKGDFSKECGSFKESYLLTFKTLLTSDEAFYEMGRLLCDVYLTASRWVDANQDKLIRRGFLCKKAESDNSGLICATLERARERYNSGFTCITDLYTGKRLSLKEINKEAA